MQCDIENELRAFLREAGLKLRHARAEIVRLAHQKACFGGRCHHRHCRTITGYPRDDALELARLTKRFWMSFVLNLSAAG